MRIDLSNVQGEVFYKYIYPINAEAFLFGSDYSKYAEMIESKFVLNETQWEYILDQWEFKESSLTDL